MGNCSVGTSVGSVSNGDWGKYGVVFVSSGGSSILLATCGSLTGFFPIESFESFFQKYPRYFKGVPLGYQKFVFDVSCQTARNVAESEVINLSELKIVEYPYKVFLFGFATFTGGKVSVQGVRIFGKQVLMLCVVVTCITKSQSQGNRSGLRRFDEGYSP